MDMDSEASFGDFEYSVREAEGIELENCRLPQLKTV